MMAFTRVRTMMLLLLSISSTVCHAIPSPNLKIQTYITHHSGNTDEVLNVPLYRYVVTPKSLRKLFFPTPNCS